MCSTCLIVVMCMAGTETDTALVGWFVGVWDWFAAESADLIGLVVDYADLEGVLDC